jgi:hypothetical protein
MSITAKIIADSISESTKIRLTTFELEYPRFIHAEFMTHRLFSRNAASSRAIPVERALTLIKEDTAMPSHWGKNQPGMSAKEECHTNVVVDDGCMKMSYGRKQWWNLARDSAIYYAELLSKAGYHKQIVNRLTEPFSHIKVVMTATELANFFHLRRHPDAQPEIHELADQMFYAMEASIPYPMIPGQWHVPYFQDGVWTPENTDTTLEDALAISVSCCAQVSYRRLDDSIEKARMMVERLKTAEVVHASPFEHQATPLETYNDFSSTLNIGTTSFSYEDGKLIQWSGNFKEWCQYRQLIPSHVIK